MAVKRLLVIVIIVLVGCGADRNIDSAVFSEDFARVAILAPFEGRYREIGYDLLYSANLALVDSDLPNIELLPIDDGGTEANAVDRARALANNPFVRAVIVAGYDATTDSVLSSFGDVPVIIVGGWGAETESEHIFALSASEVPYSVDARLSVIDAVDAETPLVGGEVFALKQFPELRADLDEISVLLHTEMPDEAFAERYLAVNPFAVEPGNLAMLAYDATKLTLQAVHEYKNRADITTRLREGVFDSLSGTIRFENGYWIDAPMNLYIYDHERQLVPVRD